MLVTPFPGHRARRSMTDRNVMSTTSLTSPTVLFWAVPLLHSIYMFMGDAKKYKETKDPAYKEEVIQSIYGYHKRMKDLVIAEGQDCEKPVNEKVFTSVSFAGGGFRTISYAPSCFYLLESKRQIISHTHAHTHNHTHIHTLFILIHA